MGGAPRPCCKRSRPPACLRGTPAENSYLASDTLESGAMEHLLDSSVTYRIAVGAQLGGKVFTPLTLSACDESLDDDVGKVAGFSRHGGVALGGSTPEAQAAVSERCTMKYWCRGRQEAGSDHQAAGHLGKRLSRTQNGTFSLPVEDAVPRRHDAPHLIPSIRPFALRAGLSLFKIALPAILSNRYLKLDLGNDLIQA